MCTKVLKNYHNFQYVIEMSKSLRGASKNRKNYSLITEKIRKNYLIPEIFKIQIFEIYNTFINILLNNV